MRFKDFYLNENRKIPTDLELYEKYKNQNVYYSYRSIDKLGINPKSKYNTPNGIYAYPVKYQDPDVKFTGGSNTGFVYFFKLKPGTKLLNLAGYTRKDFESDLKKLETAGYKVDLDFSDAKKESYAGNFWFVTYKNRGNATKWNYLLRKVLGYDAILDIGAGIIHDNEPAQLVVLNPTSIEILEKGEFDKRKPFEKFDTTNLKKESQLKYVDAFINNLKKTGKKKVINGTMLVRILNGIHPDNYKQFIETHIDDIILIDLSIISDPDVSNLDEKTTRDVLIYLSPIVDKLLNENPRNIRYFPENYQMELINHFKQSFPDSYSNLYSISHVKNLDDRLEYLKQDFIKPWVLRELKSEPGVVLNSFKTQNLNIDKMIKVVEMFKSSILKFDKDEKMGIFRYLTRYIDTKHKQESIKKLLGLK